MKCVYVLMYLPVVCANQCTTKREPCVYYVPWDPYTYWGGCIVPIVIIVVVVFVA